MKRSAEAVLKCGLIGVVALGLVGCGESPEVEEKVGAVLAQGNCPSAGGGQLDPDKVCVCTDSFWNGSCQLLDPTQRFYSNLETIFSGVYGDSINSIIVGNNVKAKICRDDTYRSNCDILAGGTAITNLSGSFTSVPSNSTSSIMVYPATDNCASPPNGTVALYRDTGPSGQCSLVKVGFYQNASFNADANGNSGGFGLPHDSVSAVVLGPHTDVLMYKESGFVGTSWRRTNSSNSVLIIPSIHSATTNPPNPAFGDVASSMFVGFAN